MAAAALPLLAAALLGAEVLAARRGPQVEEPPAGSLDGAVAGSGSAVHVLWLGDSTAAGVGASAPGASLPRRVAHAIGGAVTLTVLAHSGDGVGDVVEDQVPQVAAAAPATVFVSVGANDAVHLTRKSDFRARYRALLDGLPADVEVVLLGVPDMGAPTRLAQPLRTLAGWRGRVLDRAVRALARELGHTYVDIAGETGPTFRRDPGRFFAADRYHPSDEGYRLWAEAVAEAVQHSQR